MEFKEIKYETTPQWNTIEFTSERGNHEMTVSSIDRDGEIEIEMVAYNESTSVFLTQDNIKQLITHLQKQLK